MDGYSAAKISAAPGSKQKLLSGQRRVVAFLVACLLLVLHTTGEAFHYLAHQFPDIKSSSYTGTGADTGSAAQIKKSTSHSDSIQTRIVISPHRDNCALCSVNSLGGLLGPSDSSNYFRQPVTLAAASVSLDSLPAPQFQITGISPRGPPARG